MIQRASRKEPAKSSLILTIMKLCSCRRPYLSFIDLQNLMFTKLIDLYPVIKDSVVIYFFEIQRPKRTCGMLLHFQARMPMSKGKMGWQMYV